MLNLHHCKYEYCHTKMNIILIYNVILNNTLNLKHYKRHFEWDFKYMIDVLKAIGNFFICIYI